MFVLPFVAVIYRWLGACWSTHPAIKHGNGKQVNVPFWGYWTSPLNGNYGWDTSWLGDVQTFTVMTHGKSLMLFPAINLHGQEFPPKFDTLKGNQPSFTPPSPHQAVAIPHAVLLAPSVGQTLATPVQHIFLGNAVVGHWIYIRWSLFGEYLLIVYIFYHY